MIVEFGHGRDCICSDCAAQYQAQFDISHTLFGEFRPHPATPGPTTGLDFSQALAALRAGKRVRRKGEQWHLVLATAGVATIRYRNGFDDYWASTQMDLLATDWSVVE